MDIQNYFQATEWLAQSAEISVVDGKFVKLGLFYSFSFILRPSYQAQTAQKIVSFLEQQTLATTVEREVHLSFSKVLIKRWNSGYGQTKKIAAYFERNLLKDKWHPEYINCDNEAALKKWRRNGQLGAIFQKHPEFYDYLESMGLLSQMKITRDKVCEMDGVPSLLVDGHWTTFPVLKRTFEVVDAPRYGEKFVVNKKNRRVYTYLDNGKGLQQHHPYVDDFKPISNLNEEEYEQTLAKAKLFIRAGEENLSADKRAQSNAGRTHIIQIVSSFVEGWDTNITNLLQRAKHPYFHLILGENSADNVVKKGDVFGIGFGWKQQPLFPFSTSQGQFRSPDVWEYIPCKKRLVTNIAITPEEAQSFLTYTKKYHDDEVFLGRSVSFHLVRQNCSVYVRNALQSIGILAPTEIDLSFLIAKIAPELIKKGFQMLFLVKSTAFSSVYKVISLFSETQMENFKKITSTVHSWIKKFLKSVVEFGLTPLHVVIGEADSGGIIFAKPEKAQQQIEPTQNNWKDWFQLSLYKLHIPGILQEWQYDQASTVIYNDPIKLCIVPH